MNDPVVQAAESYQQTLRAVASILRNQWGENAPWGIAGLNEQPLVLLLGESLRANGWNVSVKGYEHVYQGSRCRTDLLARRNGSSLWIEARWWWFESSATEVLYPELASKLLNAPLGTTPLALIFTVDSDYPGWTLDGATDCMQQVIRHANLEGQWKVRACATAVSPYHGVTTAEQAIRDRLGGLFGATFLERLRGTSQTLQP
jgi:hypothetical protein